MATLDRDAKEVRIDEKQGKRIKKKTVIAGDGSDRLLVYIVVHPSVQAEEDADDEKHA